MKERKPRLKRKSQERARKIYEVDQGVISWQLEAIGRIKHLYWLVIAQGIFSVVWSTYRIIAKGAPLLDVVSLLMMSLIILFFYPIILQDFVLQDLQRTGNRFFLCGFRVFQFFDRMIFKRIAVYVDHGCCYEAAALVMLIFRKNPTSRLVIADAKPSNLESHTQHAWVEMWSHGFWWAIDPTWGEGIVMLRRKHTSAYDVKYRRVIKHREFWEIPLAGKFYEAISSKETSHVFLDLVAFRCPRDGRSELCLEAAGDDLFLRTEGKCWNYRLILAYGEKTPITRRMLRTFMAKLTRTHPKRHDFRKAEALIRNQRRAYKKAMRDAASAADEAYTEINSKLVRSRDWVKFGAS